LEQAALMVEALSQTSSVSGFTSLQSALPVQAEHNAPALDPFAQNGAPVWQSVLEPQATQRELVAPPFMQTGVPPLQSVLVLHAYAVCAQDELVVPPLEQLSAVSALLSLQSPPVLQV
jgi:hypothetical protein